MKKKEMFVIGMVVGCIVTSFIAVPFCLAGHCQIIEKYQDIIYTYINETSEPDAIDWDQLAYEEGIEILRHLFLPENENTTVTITYDGSHYLINRTEYCNGEVLMYSNTFVEFIDGDFRLSC